MKRLSLTAALSIAILSVFPRSSEASAFVIKLLTSASSGGRSRAAAEGPIGGLGGVSSGQSLPALTLGGPAIGGGVASKRKLDGSNPREVVRGITREARTAAASQPLRGPSFVSPVSSGSTDIVYLTLGHGDSLVVSPAVGESLVSNLSRWNGPTANLTTSFVNDSPDVVKGSPVVANTISNDNSPGSGGVTNADDVIHLVLPEIAPGIVFSADEISGLLPGSESNSGAQALDIASAPEPGSLLLLASGLAMAARWMRGRRSQTGKPRIVRTLR